MISFDSEKHLEDAIFDAMKSGVCPITDRDSDGVFRQLSIGGGGVIDIMALRDVSYVGDIHHATVTIYELKNRRFSKSDLAQIARYKHAVEDWSERSEKYELYVECVLVIPKSFDESSSDGVFLVQACEWLECYEFVIDLKSGINFNAVDSWSLNDKNNACKNALDNFCKEHVAKHCGEKES